MCIGLEAQDLVFKELKDSLCNYGVRDREPWGLMLETGRGQTMQGIVCNGKVLDFFFFKDYLFIYFWLCWVFVVAHGLSLDAVSGRYSSLQCMGFSLQWLLLLQSMGSRHAGFSSCGTRVQ